MGAPPLLRSVLDPVGELIGDIGEHLTADRELIAVEAEEPDHSLGLLERMQEAVEQDAIETPVGGPNVCS